MEHTFVNSQALTKSRILSWLVPHRIALIIMWLVTSITMMVMLMNGVQGTNRYIVIRYTLQAIYVVVLIWYLARTGTSSNELPALNPQASPRWKLVSWLPVLAIAVIFWLNLISDDGRDLLIMLMMAASGIFLLVWRRDIRLRTVILGLLVALVAYLVGLQMVNIGIFSKSWNIILTTFILPMFVVGGLLSNRTKVGGVQLLSGQYGDVLRSLLIGCLLFVPLGLINAFGGSMIITSSVDEWWMPLWFPFWSGITEETWFRLYLVGLCIFLLRPAFFKYPNLVVVAAVLFSGIVFGVGHGRTLEMFLTTGLLYGVPFAVIFVKRDWEHAVGAHYMVNMIPAVVAFLLR